MIDKKDNAISSTAQMTLRYMWLAVFAAVLTISLKMVAWKVSGSVGLFSDAAESFVNLASALFALAMLRIAHEPADETHPFGHSKAEYFSSGFEGTMIVVAACFILYSALPRLFYPQPLKDVGAGLWFSVVSAAINLGVALLLGRAGKKLNSIALSADSRHLMTDVWTTGGVIAGLLAVMLTQWQWLDTAIAIAVAMHILFEGYKLMRESVNGLMDKSLPQNEIRQIEALLQHYRAQGVHYAHLKTRLSASQRFILVNILVPSTWPVGKAHELLDEIEEQIRQTLNGAVVSTHLEPYFESENSLF